jgi:regulator of protease activity HflC (stomatin/prohibitin superfamily)
MGYVFAAAAFVVLAAIVLVRRVTIFEYERGVKYTRGKLVGILEAGPHWITPIFTKVEKVDVRPRIVAIPGQEVLSADGVTLKVSLAASYKMSDPAKAINEVEDCHAALYVVLQLALREIVGSAAIDDVLAERATFGQRLMELGAEQASELGLTLLSADVKDIMFPGPLRQVFAQVVAARKEGQAALERARGETAALRHMANAANLMERNPALLQLRAIQSVGDSSGNTLIMGIPPQSAPLPIKAEETEKSSGG